MKFLLFFNFNVASDQQNLSGLCDQEPSDSFYRKNIKEELDNQLKVNLVFTEQYMADDEGVFLFCFEGGFYANSI